MSSNTVCKVLASSSMTTGRARGVGGPTASRPFLWWAVLVLTVQTGVWWFLLWFWFVFPRWLRNQGVFPSAHRPFLLCEAFTHISALFPSGWSHYWAERLIYVFWTQVFVFLQKKICIVSIFSPMPVACLFISWTVSFKEKLKKINVTFIDFCSSYALFNTFYSINLCWPWGQ